jgi:hypothetical protein
MTVYSPEFILLIISLSSNILIILKKIKLITTPCCIVDCREDRDIDKKESESEQPMSFSQKVIDKLTPRTKMKIIKVIKTEEKNENKENVDIV